MVQTTSKIRKSGLTPSRKTRRRSAARRAGPGRMDCLDALAAHHAHIAALAGLLEACGDTSQGEPLERKLVGDTGNLILREVWAAKALLQAVWKEVR